MSKTPHEVLDDLIADQRAMLAGWDQEIATYHSEDARQLMNASIERERELLQRWRGFRAASARHVATVLDLTPVDTESETAMDRLR